MRARLEYEDLGLVFDPSECHDTLRYSQIPTPILLSEDVIRIYLAGRNHQNETFIYSIDVCSNSCTNLSFLRVNAAISPSALVIKPIKLPMIVPFIAIPPNITKNT